MVVSSISSSSRYLNEPRTHLYGSCSKAILVVASLLLLVSLVLSAFAIAVGLPLILIPSSLLFVECLLLFCLSHIKRSKLKKIGTAEIPALSSPPRHRKELRNFDGAVNPFNYNNSLAHFWQKQQSFPHSAFIPVDMHAPLSVWKHPYANTTLVVTTGDIASPRLRVSKCHRALFVNAANPNMSKNGGGTNRAFTAAVSSKCWDESKEKRTKLEVGDCTAGAWEDAPSCKKSSFMKGCSQVYGRGGGQCNWGYPTHFAQLLGPQADQCNNDPQRCFELVRKGYLNCFEKARALSCKLVQLPLIASNLYAPSPSHPNHRRWIEAAKAALLSALEEFSDLYPSYQLLVVVTNLHTTIFE